MSLDSLNSTINAIRGEAAQVQSAHVDAVRSIDQNERASMLAKREMLAERREQTKATLDALQGREDTAVESTRLALKRVVSGTAGDDPTGVISFRDAYDRAGALADRSDAREAMSRALDLGDEVLAQAILHRAVEMGFRDTIDTYTALHPEKADTIADLENLHRFTSDLSHSVAKMTAYLVPSVGIRNVWEGAVANGQPYYG